MNTEEAIDAAQKNGKTAEEAAAEAADTNKALMIGPVENLKMQAKHILCRICFSKGEPDDELLTPCNCSGSQRFVHASCLRTWPLI